MVGWFFGLYLTYYDEIYFAGSTLIVYVPGTFPWGLVQMSTELCALGYVMPLTSVLIIFSYSSSFHMYGNKRKFSII